MHTRGLIWSAGPPTVGATRALRAAPGAAPAAEEPQHDTPLTGRDEAIFLLHIGAEIEHSLMVQYLYAAYSLDPTGVPKDLCEQVQAWQHSILDIAREEMGHLVTVQNLLRVIGGPLNFEREDFPFRSGFYPFHFRLEPLSVHSLAKYVVAEMPVNPQEPDIDDIKREASTGNQGMDVNRVGILYEKVISLLEDSERVPDADFESNSVGYQADFATWGRNYTRVPRPGPPPPPGPAPGARAPQLIVRPVQNRTQALAALRAVSEQGEGLADPETELSHFQRFLEIYRAFSKETRSLVRNVASNPVTTEREAEVGDTAPSLITHATSLLWAQLFNTRYRMLLDLLAHALHVEGPLQAASGPSPRGRVIAGAFAEMYHLRALSDVIMRQPLTDPPSPLRCGPPFELPYTLSLPDLVTSRWRLHRDVLLSSGKIIADLRQCSDLTDAKLLDSLEAEDARFLAFIADVLGSPSPV